MADWEWCRNHLNWSANHETKTWQQHSAALFEYASGDENKAFDIILHVQKKNEDAQRVYRECRDADKSRFWKTAQDVYVITGPRKDA